MSSTLERDREVTSRSRGHAATLIRVIFEHGDRSRALRLADSWDSSHPFEPTIQRHSELLWK